MDIKNVVSKIYFLLFALCLQVFAQLSTHEIPVGFKYNYGKEVLPIMVMPAIDTVKLKKEDVSKERFGIPPRFGFKHTVDLNLTKAGKLHVLENGDKLWQLAIVCSGALSVNLLYDKF